MILFVFISIAVIYYLIQSNKIKRVQKREYFKEKQEEKLKQLLEQAREEDAKKAEENK